MQKWSIVKKDLDEITKHKIIIWDIELLDLQTWEYIKPNVKTKIISKTILSNNKKFMKKIIDRKLSMAIKKDLSLLEKEMLLDVLDYLDNDNIIDFKKLAFDYEYTSSKISKARKLLMEKLLIKEKNWFYYLTPLIWYQTKEIPEDLIEMFKDSFEKYWVEIKF